MVVEEFHVFAEGSVSFPFVKGVWHSVGFESFSVGSIDGEASGNICGLANFLVPVPC